MGSITQRTALSLQCIGMVIGSDPGRILDGRTANGTVGLATGNVEPFTGARWLARPDPSAPNNPSQIVLECLGHIAGPRFLDGRTQDGSVGLAPNTDPPFTGTRWQVIDAGSDQVNLRCLGTSTQGKNVRFLHGNIGQGTLSLVAQAGDVSSATRWQVLDAQPKPHGGPGVTSASSKNSPSLITTASGIGGPAFVMMAWRASDPDPRNDGRISIMVDLLGSQPFTTSLANKCIDRPALAIDEATRKIYLAWTATDQSINVMSSDDGLAFANRVQLPGKSAFGPTVAAVDGTPVVCWTDSGTRELKMMNGLNAPVFSFGETSSAAPALGFFPEFVSKPLIVAWTGTNNERQLNVSFSEFQPKFPPKQHKTTLPTDGSAAATSISGPSLAFKVGPNQMGFLVMSWAGLPGGPDHDNHPNVIFSSNFELFDQRETFRPVTGVGPAVVDVTRAADGKVFVAWVDRQSQKIVAASSDSSDLPPIPA